MQNKEKPIDAVICWVDGSDPEWLREKNEWAQRDTGGESRNDRQWNRGDIRFRDWELLHFFFRGIEKNAPWIRTVWFITWGHIPKWLKKDHPKLKIVRHEDYIPAEFLPTFNSHTIELNLHRIEGLAEQFIYFNDDMFLTAPVKPEDFFRNGLPRDTAVLNPVPMTRKVGHAEINNIGIINDHFEKNKVIAAHPFKWFNIRYGTKMFRNVLLMPWKQFVGLYEQHLPTSFLKSSFEEVWKAEEEELRETCRCKFRNRSNVNQWLIKNWQIAEGRFAPRSFRIGKMFMYGEKDNYDEVCEEIGSGKWKMVCVNDTEETDNFEKRREQLSRAFEKVLAEKSEFEV